MSLRDRKRARTRQALIDAAVDLIERKGYEATTIADIAAAAEIGTRTFFSYFPSKEDLLFPETDRRVRVAVDAIAGRSPDEEPADVLLRALRDANGLPRPPGRGERGRPGRRLRRRGHRCPHHTDGGSGAPSRPSRDPRVIAEGHRHRSAPVGAAGQTLTRGLATGGRALKVTSGAEAGQAVRIAVKDSDWGRPRDTG
jgi:hypothetical protein